MKFNLKAETKTDVLYHLLIMAATGILVILGFFYLYLPWVTRHGETVTVPNLMGKSISEIETILDQADLDYTIDDSTFVPGQKPLQVLSQFPEPGSMVKKSRTIFLTISAMQAPLVALPDLMDQELRNAQSELESHGLLLGTIQYKPDERQNRVLAMMQGTKKLDAGTRLPKGSRIDLEIGDGLGQQEFETPDLISKPRDEAETALAGSSLQLGAVVYDPKSKEPEGTVIKQKPAPGEKIRVGAVVDIWISGPDPAEQFAPSSLD